MLPSWSASEKGKWFSLHCRFFRRVGARGLHHSVASETVEPHRVIGGVHVGENKGAALGIGNDNA